MSNYECQNNEGEADVRAGSCEEAHSDTADGAGRERHSRHTEAGPSYIFSFCWLLWA